MTVAVVLDPSYKKLKELVARMPVWAIESPPNRESAKQLWPTLGAANHEAGLTLFKVFTTDTLANFLAVIEDVELHHPPATELRIIGVRDSDLLRTSLKALNYSVSIAEDSIVAVKDSN
jgi:hypothetical protein